MVSLAHPWQSRLLAEL
jgi:hypothetical protein